MCCVCKVAVKATTENKYLLSQKIMFEKIGADLLM